MSGLSRREELATARRLLLGQPEQWTVSEAEEARTCSGYCTAKYEAGIKVIDVPRPCAAHGRER